MNELSPITREEYEGVAITRSDWTNEFSPISIRSNESVATNHMMTILIQLMVKSEMRGKLLEPTTKERRFIFSERRNEVRDAKQRSPIVMDLRLFPMIT